MARRLLGLLVPAVVACSGPSERAPAPPPAPRTYYAEDAASQLRLITLDPTGQKLGECAATYVDGDIVSAPLSLIRGAHTVRATTMTARTAIPVYGYTLYDFASDVCLLRVGKRNDRRARPAAHAADTTFCVEGTYQGKLFRHDTTDGVPPGSGLFNNAGELVGMLAANGSIVPAATLDSLRQRQTQQHRSVYELRLKTGRTYLTHQQVKACHVSTTLGDFDLQLFDDVPEYPDNFIRLVSDHYYDSLLVHRVLPNFLIQTGAADTKYAGPDDVVGWQGPGYTLPMVADQKHWHVRGAVAASKLPAEKNQANRCDGGQFYVVLGRTFTPAELDKMEREEHKHFTAQQRADYTGVGGAPYLDGDYVVFGRVTAGLDVVRNIAAQPVSGDRPVRDIRVKRITLVRR